jgi:hypothetical protein
MARAEFLEVYQKLKHELLEDTDAFSYTDDSRQWVEKVSILFLPIDSSPH